MSSKEAHSPTQMPTDVNPSGPDIEKLKNFWQQGVAGTRQAPFVKSKNRASILLLNSMADRSDMNVKRRVETWSKVVNSEQADNRLKETTEDVKPAPGDVKSRIKVWKNVTGNQTTSGSTTEPIPSQTANLPVRIDIKSRIQDYCASANEAVKSSGSPETARADLPVQTDVKSRIHGYCALTTETSTPYTKVDALEDIALTAKMEESRISDIPISSSTVVKSVSPDSSAAQNEQLKTDSRTNANPSVNLSEDSVNPAGLDPSTPDQCQTAVCLYNYIGAEDDELSFSVGDVIFDIDQLDEGWWLGTTADGHRGLFPSNYVELTA